MAKAQFPFIFIFPLWGLSHQPLMNIGQRAFIIEDTWKEGMEGIKNTCKYTCDMRRPLFLKSPPLGV